MYILYANTCTGTVKLHEYLNLPSTKLNVCKNLYILMYEKYEFR